MRIPGCLLFMWGVFSSLRFRVSVVVSQKNPISTLWKWKKHFSWDETKIGLCGVPFHPKGYARVRYGLVLTNYAMLMAESSLFNLKVMQPQMWKVISVKGLSGKQFFSRFEFFFPLLGHIKWHHTKVLHFFVFFWVSYARFRTRMKWRRMKTPARGQEVRSLLFPPAV
jgi:hypothetical protein